MISDMFFKGMNLAKGNMMRSHPRSNILWGPHIFYANRELRVKEVVNYLFFTIFEVVYLTVYTLTVYNIL